MKYYDNKMIKILPNADSEVMMLLEYQTDTSNVTKILSNILGLA